MSKSEATGTAASPTSQWILLRGLARESRHWGSFPQQLETELAMHGGPARVDCFDLPGAGKFSEMRSPISIPEIAEFVRGKFLELRQRRREAGEAPAAETYLVAMSFGGMIASHWLEHWPDDFRGGILINTSFKRYSPFYRRLLPRSYPRFASILSGSNVLERESEVLKMVSNRPEIRDETATAWARIQLDRPITRENFARQLLAAARFAPMASKPAVPILLLNSLKDRMVDPSCSLEIAERWHAELRRHPTAGHDLPLDAGPWTAAQIAEWWENLRGSRGHA